MSFAHPPFEPGSLPPGTKIAGKYLLAEPIGWGEHSVVYAGTHLLLQRKAAVKILAKTDEESERRFAREAKLAGSIQHENIVDLYEIGRLADGRAFIAMEFLDGETLEERLGRVGPFGVAEAMTIGQQLLRGLAVAHENQIVHRDLRPQNIFMAMIRGKEVLKIVDFGVSRRFGNEGDSMLKRGPGMFLGNIQYVAPEQLQEDGIIDQRTDLYAVGVFLYRLLTGRVPFEGPGSRLLLQIVKEQPEAPSARCAELTSEVDHVVLRALAKEPKDRFADAESMAEALRLTALFSSYVTA